MFMFRSQKGILPYTLLIVGAVTVMVSGIIFILLSPEPKPIFIRDLKPPDDLKIRVSIYIFAVLFFFFGMYLANIYPRILLTRGGIHYLGFMFYYGRLKWSEIDDLIELKNGTILVQINPKRFFLFKGMLFQRLTGALLGFKRPVLLLSPGLNQREQTVEKIMANSLIKKVHRFGNSDSNF